MLSASVVLYCTSALLFHVFTQGYSKMTGISAKIFTLGVCWLTFRHAFKHSTNQIAENQKKKKQQLTLNVNVWPS